MQGTAMTTPSPSSAAPSNAAPANAAEIGRRVLQLIDTIHGPEQVAAAHIERVTGIPVEFNDANPQQYGFGGQLSTDWAYNLVSLTELDGSKPHRLMFSLDDRSADANADMAPIDPLAFDACNQALASAGYTGTPNLGRYGQVEYWAYQRGDVSLQVHVRGESDAKAERACVSMIVINA
jgi:hypothetical protein